MLPTYQPGDLLVGWRWFTPRERQVVVARFDKPVIKRVRRLERDGAVWLEGDNVDESADSRRLGAVPPEQLEARVLLRLGGGRRGEGW